MAVDNFPSDKMRLSCDQAAVTDVAEVSSALNVSLDRGLSNLEASRRREYHGFNEVTGHEPDPLWRKYLEQFNNPFILLLLASALISVLMKQFDDAISIAIAIVIVVTVGFVQEYRSENTLESLGALLPPSCRVVRDGSVANILARYLVPGDVVQLAVGDRVPADLRLFQVNELNLDESSFTGEPICKMKSTGRLAQSNDKLHISDMTNVAFQGTLVTHGNGRGIVVSTGENSQFGELFRMMREEETPRTPLQKSMDTLGKQLSIYSIGVIFAIMAIGCLQGRPVLEMFNVGVSLAVAAIPEGLPIVVTVTLAFGVMRMAKKKAIVKRLPTVEALGCVDFICSDKTGTLTTNSMTVFSELTSYDILKVSSEDNVEEDANIKALMEVAVLCNNAEIDDTGNTVTGSSTEAALISHAKKRGMDKTRLLFRRVAEVPFSSDRKFMSVQCVSLSNSLDVVARHYVKGALEEMVPRCKSVSTGVRSVPMDGQVRASVEQAGHDMACKGLRVIALARGRALSDLEFVGLLGLYDPPRPGVDDSIRMLQASRVRISMITGDSKDTASAIAATLGLEAEGKTLISGAEVEAMSDQELQSTVDNVFCYYRTTPVHKVRIVKALKDNGHIVGMTGDGVNDGVAVKSADVGISMGESGTDVCKEAADVILLDDNFSTIVSAIEEGKCIFYNIRNFVRFQLSTSIAALMLISLSTLLDKPNPLNPMQILWINVIMDGPPAQSLGLEPVDHDVLRKPPRHAKEPILTRGLMANILLSAFIIICGTLFVFKITMEDGHMTARDTTMTFTCFVFFDMFNALSSRSQEKLISEIGFFSNHVFCVAVALSVLGQLAVIYFPPLQYVFQTEALAFSDLVMLAGLSSSVFIVCEVKKLLERSFSHNGGYRAPASKKNGFCSTSIIMGKRKAEGHIV